MQFHNVLPNVLTIVFYVIVWNLYFMYLKNIFYIHLMKLQFVHLKCINFELTFINCKYFINVLVFKLSLS